MPMARLSNLTNGVVVLLQRKNALGAIPYGRADESVSVLEPFV